MNQEYLYKRTFPNGKPEVYITKRSAGKIIREYGLRRGTKILGLIALNPVLRDEDIIKELNERSYTFFNEVYIDFWKPCFSDYHWAMKRFEKRKIIKSRIENLIPECTGSKASCEKLLEWTHEDKFTIESLEYLKKYYVLPYETRQYNYEDEPYLKTGCELYKNIIATAMLVAFKKEETPVLYQGVEHNDVYLISGRLEQ